MGAPFWIGVVFAAVLVVFLIVAFFIKENLSSSQHNTIRFLSSLCGGGAAGFLAGEALLTFQGTLPTGATLAVSGTAGFAIFFLVWLTYPKHHAAVGDDRIRISVPKGWTFEKAVRAIVKAAGASVVFQGLTQKQLEFEIGPQEIDAPDPLAALRQLNSPSAELPRVTVDLDNGAYRISNRKEA